MERGKQTYRLPKGWIWTNVSELFVIIGGGTPTKNNSRYWGGSINWASVKDIKSQYLLTTEDKITEEGVESSNTKIANEGDVVLVTRISPGQVSIVKSNTAINQDLKILKLFGGMNPSFVYFLLISQNHQFLKHASGTTVKGVKINDIISINLPLPPLKEQQRIVSKIESLFSELEQAEKGLQKANRQLEVYRQALLKSAFEGELTRNWSTADEQDQAKLLLKRILHNREEQYRIKVEEWKQDVIRLEKTNNFAKIPSKPTRNQEILEFSSEELKSLYKLPETWEWEKVGNFSFVTKLAGFEFSKFIKYSERGDIPVIKAQNIGTNNFKEGNFSFVDKTALDKLPRISLNGGEILFVFIGAGIGNVGIAPSNRKYLLGPNVAMLRLPMEINNKFVMYFLSSLIGKKHITYFTQSSAQGSISMGSIRKIAIPIPSNKEQNKIVEILESRFTLIENLEKSINKCLNDISLFKHSVLKKAFEGKLVSQYSKDESAELLLQKIKKEKEEYLIVQKVIDKLIPKKKRQMETKKTVFEILSESEEPISTQELWTNSIHDGDIESFYSEIKEIYSKLTEVKEDTESLLSLKK